MHLSYRVSQRTTQSVVCSVNIRRRKTNVYYRGMLAVESSTDVYYRAILRTPIFTAEEQLEEDWLVRECVYGGGGGRVIRCADDP